MSMSEKEKDDLSGIGRYDLIEHISARSGIVRSETSFGSATVEGTNNLLISQNLMLEGIDFSLVYFPLKHLGYKLVIRTLAGIYASGGIPEAISVTIGMSSRFGADQANDLFEGIAIAAKKYGAEIKYYDFVSTLTGMTLACTAWGQKEVSLPPAGNPSVNDLICVTGDLGAAYMGLQVLERERRIFESGATVQPDLSNFQYVISRQLKPDLKIAAFSALRKTIGTSMVATVIREGLASELLGMCKKFGLGCKLFYEKIPVDNETYSSSEEMSIDPVVAALNGGEDYEFLILAPVTMANAISELKDIRMVGFLTDPSEGCLLVTPGDEVVELRAQGWKG